MAQQQFVSQCQHIKHLCVTLCDKRGKRKLDGNGGCGGGCGATTPLLVPYESDCYNDSKLHNKYNLKQHCILKLSVVIPVFRKQ